MLVTAPALVVKQLRGIQNVLRMVGLFQFSWLFKDQSSLEASGIGQEGIKWFERSGY
jgi:hypothetical protein